jgi:hypothetical protein
MRFLRSWSVPILVVVCSCGVYAQTGAQSSSSSKKPKRPAAQGSSALEPGSVVNGVYRNRTLSLSCKVPAGWVLRTEEMNSADDETSDQKPAPQGSTREQRVLLATFSRPPEARGEDINSSILIAEEPVSTYPGLKDAPQYFAPLSEVAKAQGFTADEDPYEFAVGARNLVRGDFHKDVGTRVMRQSTLAFLSHGYVVSITVIGGTEDELEELIDGVRFAGK